MTFLQTVNDEKKIWAVLKRGITAFLVLMICICSSIGQADTFRKINSQVVKNANYSANEWFATSETRATLTVALAIDVFCQMPNFDSDLLTEYLKNSSYVAISDNQQQVVTVGYYNSTVLGIW